MFLSKFDKRDPSKNFTFNCDPKAVKRDSAKVLATLIQSAEEDHGNKLSWVLTGIEIMGKSTTYELSAGGKYFIQWESK